MSLPTKPQSNSGLTLIEVMVSLSIFGLVLTAILFMLTTNVYTADSIKDNSVAAGLAQEGMEIIRNIRDNEWFTSKTFGNNLPDGTYLVQWNSTALLTDNGNPAILEDQGTRLFGYDFGLATIFHREVKLTTISANEKRVTVTITWLERGVTKTMVVEDHLFNWL